MDKPANIKMAQDGFYYTPDGTRYLCEDCWKPIPRYVDFPQGLTSPESDGDAGGNFAKKRKVSVDGKTAWEPLRKAVCLSCYQSAFARVHPDAITTEFSDLVIPDTKPFVPEETIESAYVGPPREI